MTGDQFAYWLQGSLELNGPLPFVADQIEIINKHINLVRECLVTPVCDERALATRDFVMWLSGFLASVSVGRELDSACMETISRQLGKLFSSHLDSEHDNNDPVSVTALGNLHGNSSGDPTVYRC